METVARYEPIEEQEVVGLVATHTAYSSQNVKTAVTTLHNRGLLSHVMAQGIITMPQ